MLKKIVLILLVVPLNLLGQTKFKSTKYNYSFVIPPGWHQKNQITNPDVDAKIVDGKGNSFIISIKTFPTSTDLTAREQMESSTNRDLEEQFDAVYGTTKVVKRGITTVGIKEFYYFHLLTPYIDGFKLYHKQFLYSEGYKTLSIDACAIETYVDETAPSFAIMIATFEFNGFKQEKKQSTIFREL